MLLPEGVIFSEHYADNEEARGHIWGLESESLGNENAIIEEHATDNGDKDTSGGENGWWPSSPISDYLAGKSQQQCEQPIDTSSPPHFGLTRPDYINPRLLLDPGINALPTSLTTPGNLGGNSDGDMQNTSPHDSDRPRWYRETEGKVLLRSFLITIASIA